MQSALKLVSDEPAPPVGGVWLDLDEAARRSHKSPGHLARSCRDKWFHQGLARRMPNPRGPDSWQISELADAAFTTASPARQDCDLTGLTDEQRDAVLHKEETVKAYIAARSASVTLGLIEEEVKQRFLQERARLGQAISRATLHNWLAEWNASGRAGLIDKRWSQQQSAKGEAAYPVYRETLLRLYLTQRQLRIRKCHDMACYASEERGENPPGYKTAQRIIAALPPAVVTAKREGKKALLDKHTPYIERDYSTIGSNEIWCSDHHRLDVMILHEGQHVRPWLHVWQDMRSRKIVGWSIVCVDPSADLILTTFNLAVKAFGPPASVYIDNGRDFDAKALQGVTKRQRRAGANPNMQSAADVRRFGGAFALLSIEVIHCWPYHGQSKPVERFFRTVCDDFSRTFETYCGKDTVSRPEDLPQHLANGKAPTLDEVRRDFNDWLAGCYNGKVHMGDSMHGRSPDSVHIEELRERRAVSHDLLDFACMPRVRARVRQNGVHYAGISYGKSEPALHRIDGQDVMLAINVNDLRSVIVCSLEGSVICRAPANERMPVNADRQMLKEAVAQQRKDRKALTAYDEARPRLSLDPREIMVLAARKKQAKQPQPAVAVATGTDPLPITPVFTAVDDQLSAIRSVNETPSMRIARDDDGPRLPTGFSYSRSMESEGDHE